MHIPVGHNIKKAWESEVNFHDFKLYRNSDKKFILVNFVNSSQATKSNAFYHTFNAELHPWNVLLLTGFLLRFFWTLMSTEKCSQLFNFLLLRFFSVPCFAAYTSIYLTVSFTIERYIACCHPLIGQVLCTESRAKRVIAGSKIHFVYFNILFWTEIACVHGMEKRYNVLTF